MPEKVREQIIAVAETGETNMFDWRYVQVIANRMHFFELVVFLDDRKNRAEYANFIMYGDGR